MSKKTNNISIDVEVDENLIPEKITWKSSDTPKTREAKAFTLALFDEEEKSAMHIDLWNKEMSIEEMSKFFFQTYITMSETFVKATSEEEMGHAMRDFAEFFGEKMGVIEPTGKFDPPSK